MGNTRWTGGGSKARKKGMAARAKDRRDGKKENVPCRRKDRFPLAERVVVVVVQPKHPGNVGAIARSMMNFGLRELVLVNPCEITDEALARSMHAAPLLRAAKTYKTLEEALATVDHSVATTCEPSRKDKKHLRKALTPWDFSRLMPALGGKVGILLGREDFGLFNSEIEKCDLVVTIPTTDEYKSMNLSHAAAIIFYEMSKATGSGRKIRPMKEATGLEKDVLYRKFQEYLNDIGYPVHKRKNTTMLFKRLIGRSALSGWEFHTFTGVFTMGSKRIAWGVPRTYRGQKMDDAEKGPKKGGKGRGKAK